MRHIAVVGFLLCACGAHAPPEEMGTAPAGLGAKTPQPPQKVAESTTDAVAKLRATAMRMSNSHFDAHFVITGDALRELAPALESLPCEARADTEIAALKKATEEYEHSDALRHVAPARDAMKATVDALQACGHAGRGWISAARDAVAAIDTASTFELQHTHVQDALRTLIDAIAASATPAAPEALPGPNS